MADQPSSVRLNVRTGELEVSGTEEFVERIVGTVPALFATLSESLRHMPKPPDRDKVIRNDNGDEEEDSGPPSLAKFIAEKKLTKGSSHEDLVSAFVYYLTKVKRSESCGTAEVTLCYEEAAMPKAKNLAQTLNNLMKTGVGRKGYIGSAGRGRYKLTIPGENHIVEMGT